MIYTEKVIDVSNQGYGVCKLDGFTVFIKGAMKDEVVSFKLKNKKKKFAIGDLVSIDKVSPYRKNEALIESAPLFHWDYQHQLEYKNHLVENTLKNFIFEDNYQTIIGQENPYHYRNKAQIPLLENKGKVVLGEFIEGSNELIGRGSAGRRGPAWMSRTRCPVPSRPSPRCRCAVRARPRPGRCRRR